ncbi:MAG: cupredoxin domain-containing protein [Actinomycetota bacterium]
MRLRRFAGIVLLLGASCAPAADAANRTVVIRVEHSRFMPSELSIPAGTTVRFVVDNRDPIDHELIVGPQDVQDRHEQGTEAHHGERPGEISVPAGARRSTTYSFMDPGTVLFGCHLPGHYAYGMKGTITVTG